MIAQDVRAAAEGCSVIVHAVNPPGYRRWSELVLPMLDHTIAAALGGVLMLANWPYTLIVIQPTNKRLGATADEQAGPETRATIVRWGRLHAVRTMLGVAATFAFLLAAAT